MFNVLLLGEIEAGDEKSFWINILAAAAYGLAGLLIVGLYRLTRRVYSSRAFGPRWRWPTILFLSGSLLGISVLIVLVCLVRIDGVFGLQLGAFEKLAAAGRLILETINALLAWLQTPALPPPPLWLIILASVGVIVAIVRRFHLSWARTRDNSTQGDQDEVAVNQPEESQHKHHDTVSGDAIEWHGVEWERDAAGAWSARCPRVECGSKMALRPAVSDRPGIVVARPGPIHMYLECSRCRHRLPLNMTKPQVDEAIAAVAQLREKK